MTCFFPFMSCFCGSISVSWLFHLFFTSWRRASSPLSIPKLVKNNYIFWSETSSVCLPKRNQKWLNIFILASFWRSFCPETLFCWSSHHMTYNIHFFSILYKTKPCVLMSGMYLYTIINEVRCDTWTAGRFLSLVNESASVH